MKEKIAAILKRVAGGEVSPDVFVPEKGNFGHYSTNVALRLASAKDGSASGGKVERKNPLELAREMAEKISRAAPQGFFEKVEAAPPGFINFWLSGATLQKEFASVYKNLKKFGSSKVGEGKTIIVEYSQPNIAKKMHVGHLRTTIIGDTLANVIELLGYKVIRWNYLGDWGTQFGKLIAAYKLWGDKSVIEADPVNELQKLYVRFHDELKSKPELEARGQEEFRKLEEGDEENRRLWEWFKKESLKEFEGVYETLDVKFDTYIGESFYEKEIGPLVEGLLERGIAVESEGAVVIKLDQFGLPPALIRKSDGASLYLTRDIANLEYRLKKYKPDKILYVVGNEQSLHFAQLFAVAKILGWDKPLDTAPSISLRTSRGKRGKQAELEHVKYGLVLGEEGKKLATREGRVILLEDVLDKALELARKVVDEKNAELPESERKEISEAVGAGALKYGILKENRNTDITFNWGKMLDFSGDSAPYIQYTYARLRSILRKSQIANPPDFIEDPRQSRDKSQIQNLKIDSGKLNGEAELALIRKLIEFPDEVARSGEILETNNLANYLYKLASLVSRFYETTPILKEPDEKRREAFLVLIDTASSVLKSGLGLLGIKTPERI